MTKVGNPGTVTTLNSPGKAIGAASISVGSTANWPTDTAVYFAIRVVNPTVATTANPSGLVSGTYSEWKGVVSGTTISNLSLQNGADQVYPAGTNTQVFIPVTAPRENALVSWGLAQHTQAGAHQAITNTGGLTTDNLTVTGTVSGITPAKTSNPYKFSVYRNAVFTLAASGIVVLDSKLYDSGTNYSTTTGLFTAPIAGFYHFDGAVGFTGAANQNFRAALAYNTTSAPTYVGTNLYGTASVGYSVNVSQSLQLAANDTVGLFFSTGATSIGISNGTAPYYTYLSGWLVSAS